MSESNFPSLERGNLVTFIAILLASLCAGAALEPGNRYRVGNLTIPAAAAPSAGQQTSEAAATRSLASSAEQALEAGQTEKARQILTGLLQRPHVDADTLLEVGIAFAQQDLYREASQVFERCASDYPAIFEAHYDLALADFALQKYSDADAALLEARPSSQQQDLIKRWLHGKVQEVLGRPSEAERDLLAAFTQAPQQENFALDLGLFYLRQTIYPKAAEVFEQGTRFNPKSPFLWLGLSLAQFLRGQNAASIQAGKKLLALQPDFSPARLLLAFALDIDGKLDDAEEVAAKGLTDSPHPFPYLYYLHATLLLKLHSSDFDRMLRELDAASVAIPNCTLCSLEHSKVLQGRGDLPGALLDLQRTVKMDPSFPEAWYRLSLVSAQLGRSTEAQQARERFTKLKTEKGDRETEMLRQVFMGTLSSQGPSTPSQ